MYKYIYTYRYKRSLVWRPLRLTLVTNVVYAKLGGKGMYDFGLPRYLKVSFSQNITLIVVDSANLLGVQAFKGDLDSTASMWHRRSTMCLTLLLDYNYGMWKYSTMLLRVLVNTLLLQRSKEILDG